MSSERALDGILARGLAGERQERPGLVGLLQRSVPEERHARSPGGTVVAGVFGLP